MKDKVFSAFAGLGNTILAAMPKVAVGLLLLVLGLLAAKLIEVVLRRPDGEPESVKAAGALVAGQDGCGGRVPYWPTNLPFQ
jgi:hypothetical protein